jgi:hypothetical protein
VLALACGVGSALVIVLVTHLVLVALVPLGVSTVWAFLPIAGRATHSWALPLATEFLGPRSAQAPLVSHRFGGGPGPEAKRARGSERRTPWRLPGLRRLHIETASGAAGEVALVRVGAGAPLSFTLSLSGPHFALADASEQGRILSAWGSVLAACATGRLRHLQVIERALPDDGATQQRWFGRSRLASDASVFNSYAGHLTAALQRAVRHEIYLTATMSSRSSREPFQSAAQECAGLVEMLEQAGFGATPLDADSLSRLLRNMIDPTGGASSVNPGDATEVGPAAWERHWDLVRAGSACHTCYEATELPRVPLGAAWAWPIVTVPAAGTYRTIALHIELAPPGKGLRRAERAVLAHEGDEAIRARWGFRTGARHSSEAEAALKREAELAAGFSDTRFALLVAVAARGKEALEESASQVDTQAAQAQVELSRLYGQQPEALVATLPLGQLRLTGGWS